MQPSPYSQQQQQQQQGYPAPSPSSQYGYAPQPQQPTYNMNYASYPQQPQQPQQPYGYGSQMYPPQQQPSQQTAYPPPQQPTQQYPPQYGGPQTASGGMYSQQPNMYMTPQQQQQPPPFASPHHQQQQQPVMAYGQQAYMQQQQQLQQPPPRVGAAPAARGVAQVRNRLMRPPYVDPVTNVVYDIDNPDYEGWLTKQSMWLKEWRRRYFILKGSKLFYCKNEYSAPHGMIDLAVCTTVKSADLKAKKRHSLEISTPDTCFLLYADTEAEKDDWIGRVGKAIVRCSRTYYNARGGAGGNMNANNEHADNDEDDIYTNDDPDNPYFND